MTSKRRIILVFLSVTFGSLLSLWIMKKKLGTLKPQDYVQLGFNFFFAVAIVVGVALFLQYMNKKDSESQNKE